MALIEILRNVRIVLHDNGAIRAVVGDYDEKDDATGRVAPKGTKRIAASELAAALPSHAALLAAVDAANAERAVALAERDAANAERDAALAGHGVAAPEATPAQMVRDEAARRMRGMFGARDDAHLSQIIQNAQRESVRLYAIRVGIPGVAAPREWTADEALRAAQLYGADAAIEAIRAASNAMETDPPADFASNARWPSVG